MIEHFLFDLDGCIWYGGSLAEGAAELVGYLREHAKQVYFLTNSSVADAPTLAAKLGRLGIETDSSHVVAPLTLLDRHHLLQPSSSGELPTILTVGKAVIARTLEGRGYRMTADPGRADVVVVGNDSSITFADLTPALEALDGGAHLLALNLDRRVPSTGGRLVAGTGAIVAALQAATGTEPQLVGKPSLFYFRAALALFGVAADSTAIVGDSLETDIAGGRRAGIATILVGSTRIPSSVDDIEPDISLTGLPALLQLLQETKGVMKV